ncbi:hypothetical protein H0H93_005314 [Arthromyces matolae]|nr:hypothetical protein H0H93_005314 [Arthromyces matolae]
MPKQCVVSLASADLEVCHIFRPWVFDEGTLAKLEYEWGCQYGTFNYDVDTNRVYLTAELRRLFESNFWAFLPMDVTILNVLGRTSFPSKNKSIETAYNGAETFEYRLVPLPGISRNPIVRADDSAPSGSQSHHFPYTTMPVLRLPIRPHLAVMDFAHKFLKHEERHIRTSAEFQPYFKEFYLQRAHCLCNNQMWTTIKVPLEFLRALGDADARQASGETPNSYRRPGAFSFLRDDPSSIWDDDDVRLRPLDSVTNVSSHGDDDGSSDEEESDDEEETRSVFDTRMKRWIGEVGLPQSDQDVSFAHGEEVVTNPAVPDLMPSDDDSDESDGGSPSIIATVKHVVEPFPAPNDPMILSKARTRRISTVSVMSVDSSSFAQQHLYKLTTLILKFRSVLEHHMFTGVSGERVQDASNMAKLEYMWGCRYGTFDHDVETNKVYLTAELRRLFESNFWAFLPVDMSFLEVLTQTSHTFRSTSIETAYIGVGADTFDYRLVPLPGIPRSPIFRADDSAPSGSQSHQFPYITMPILRLPIRPHFAIMDFANKYTKHDRCKIRSSPEFEPHFENLYDEITHCLCVNRSWSTPRVPLEFLRALGDTDARQVSGEAPNSYRRECAFPFLRDDPASIWNEDDVRLRPLDSVTNVSSNGEDDTSSDEEDSDDEEETRSVFDARMKRWIGEVGLGHSDEEVSFTPGDEVIANSAIPDLMPSDDDSDESDGGSVSIIATVKHVVGPFPVPNDPMILSKARTRRISTVSAMSVDSSSFARA